MPHPLHPPALSITVDTLPPRRPVRLYRLPSGHLLVAIMDGLDYDRLDRIYRRVHPHARRLIYRSLRSPDPLDDPTGYARTRWWNPTDTITLDTVVEFEAAGLLTPWPHTTPARLRA